MSTQPTGAADSGISRERLLLTLAAPFVLLLAASIASWPWRSLGLPGVVGGLTPPSIALLATAVAGAMYALRRRLPVGLITWLPAGQGAIFLLTTGFLARTDDLLAGVAAIMAYVVIYVIVLGVALAVAGQSAPLAIGIVAFFVLTPITRFPIFSEASVDVPASGLLTPLALGRAMLEVGLIAWLARRLVEAPDDGTRGVVALIVGLAATHGLLAVWEDPALRGELSLLQMTDQLIRWLGFVAIQMGIAVTMIRVRRSWSQEPVWATPEGEEEEAPTPVPQAEDGGRWPFRRGGRPAPRRRRRR